MQLKDEHMGRIAVSTLALPDFVKAPSGTYTSSGTILVDYQTDGDADKKNFFRLGVLKDDGTDFREIYSGVIKQHPKANGIRFMVFSDNKRVLLGDYVLECTPDINCCETTKLVPVVYPDILYNDARVLFHWSEIIISPDNEHICWTALSRSSASVMIGRLKRGEDAYVIEGVKTISPSGLLQPDPNNEGYVIPGVLRGGEVKQFTKGGSAISLVGAKDSALSDSVIMHLDSDKVEQITRLPGYEETTILSPDERLGISMSTRFSPKTNFAILGLLPRPFGILSTQGLILPVYMYAVAGVRRFRKGNIGPVLVDIGKSMNEPGYMGVQLNAPDDNWVYLSPMSWHPNGKKALWPEMLRGQPKNKRIRIAELPDYETKCKPPTVQTPDNIPYAVDGVSLGWLEPREDIDCKIAGKHSGDISYRRAGRDVQTRYNRFSNDGESFYDGFERVSHTVTFETVYEADFTLSGEKPGEMKCRLTFSPSSLDASIPVKLLFEKADDGKAKSYGYASFDGIRLCVEDMAQSQT